MTCHDCCKAKRKINGIINGTLQHKQHKINGWQMRTDITWKWKGKKKNNFSVQTDPICALKTIVHILSCSSILEPVDVGLYRIPGQFNLKGYKTWWINKTSSLDYTNKMTFLSAWPFVFILALPKMAIQECNGVSSDCRFFVLAVLFFFSAP